MSSAINLQAARALAEPWNRGPLPLDAGTNVHPLFRTILNAHANGLGTVGKLTPAPTLAGARANAALHGKTARKHTHRVVVFTGPKGARTGREIVEGANYWEAMLTVAELLDGQEGGYRSIRCTDPEGKCPEDCNFSIEDADDTGATWRACRWCGTEDYSVEESQ